MRRGATIGFEEDSGWRWGHQPREAWPTHPVNHGTHGPASKSKSDHAKRDLLTGVAHAFTLLELLIAVAITALLAGLMLSVVTGTLAVWHRTQDDFATAGEARLMLDLIERDLQAAAFRENGSTWLAVDVINTPSALTNHGWILGSLHKPEGSESQQLVPDGFGVTPTIANARFGLSGAWLRLVTTNVEAAGSLPIAVSYQLARRPVSGSVAAFNPAEVRYTLFRSAVSPDNLFANGNDVAGSAYQSTSVTPTATRSARTLMNPNNADALASNVVDFGVWLSVRDSSGALHRVFPADNSDLQHLGREGPAGADAGRFPEIVEVMVRILGERGAALVAEMESGSGRATRPANFETDAQWWWAVVEANSRVYVRQIEIGRTNR